MKQIFIVLMVAILAIAFVGTQEVSAKGTHSGTQRVECIGEKSSLSTINESGVSTTALIKQKFGKCLFKNENSHLYITPFMPVSYKVELIDTDFGEVVKTIIITGKSDNSFKVDLGVTHEEIPYCLKVTTFWMKGSSDGFKTVETRSQTCF